VTICICNLKSDSDGWPFEPLIRGLDPMPKAHPGRVAAAPGHYFSICIWYAH